MANFWQIATSLDAAGARDGAQKAAREAKLQRKELEKQTEIMRKSSMSPEQIATEENAKTLRHGMWGIVAGVIIFIGACIAYPIFGICVGVIIVCVVKKSKKKKTK